MTAEQMRQASSFTQIFTAALNGEPCQVVGLDGGDAPLPMQSWVRPAGASDQAMLEHCVGETLDVGCGPGRMTRLLLDRGHRVLGIDIVPEAVRLSVARGAPALHRDVFAEVPREGSWSTVLLADGNIGIGGNPAALLRRTRALLSAGGRVVVDLAAPGSGLRTGLVTLRTATQECRPFAWAVVGVEAIAALAASSGFWIEDVHDHGDRWFAVLRSHGGGGDGETPGAS